MGLCIVVMGATLLVQLTAQGPKTQNSDTVAPKKGVTASQRDLSTVQQAITEIETGKVNVPNAGVFKTEGVRFDESLHPNKPTPKIPKNWKFVGVEKGSKSNETHLWFQDPAGNIFLVRGFSDYDQFILNEVVPVISAASE